MVYVIKYAIGSSFLTEVHASGVRAWVRAKELMCDREVRFATVTRRLGELEVV